MAVNKVVLGEDTLIDLTGDTVSADKLSKGITAHNMAGEPIVGTMEAGGGGPSYTAGDGITIDSSNVISNNFGRSITCSWLELDDQFSWGYEDYIKEVATTDTMSQYLGKCPVIAGTSLYTPDLSLFTDDWTGGRRTLYKYDGTNFTFTATRIDGTYYLADGHVLAKVGRQNWIDCSSIAVFRKYLSRIKYDNTNSGLTATNIPDAIDELNTKITTVEANPENPTQTLSSIKIGDVDYSVGGGGDYIFTNGLTENNGTVGWDLSDSIKNGDSGKYATRLGYMAENYNDHIQASGYGAVAFGMPNTDGYTDIISSGKGSLAFGTKDGSAYGGGIAATGEGSLAHGVSGFTTGAGLDNRRAIIASGIGSHAEGFAAPTYGGVIKATANGAHAEGGGTTASGYLSHAEGRGTIANHLAQHSAGRYNIPDDSTAKYYQYGNYAFIIGNGTSDTARSNALTVDWSGNVQASGTVIASNIPTQPSADGEYNLHCSIVNGVPTYTWKAEQQ